MKHKTSELTGALLDAAVAKAELKDFGLMSYISDMMDHGLTGVDKETGLEVCYAPSTDWRHGGPIIEREIIAIIPSQDEDGGEALIWHAIVEASWRPYEGAFYERGIYAYATGRGSTPLIAAMRAYVAHKLGDEVEL